MTRIEQIWSNETVVCIGTGPSLTQADVDACRGRARVIVVNNAYQLAPWADVLYACDFKWWRWHPDAVNFAGLKYAMARASTEPAPPSAVQILQNGGQGGLSTDRSSLKTGYTSGYSAIDLAVLLGATRILLLGYDTANGPNQRAHYFGDHPDRTRPPYSLTIEAFQTLVEPLRAAGVSVLNCSRRTALTCFPCASLESALLERAA